MWSFPDRRVGVTVVGWPMRHVQSVVVGSDGMDGRTGRGGRGDCAGGRGEGEGGLTKGGQEVVVDCQPVRGDSGRRWLRRWLRQTVLRPGRSWRRHQSVAGGAAAPLTLLICYGQDRFVATLLFRRSTLYSSKNTRLVSSDRGN